VFRLEQNYRSTKTILAAANTLIRNNIDQIPKRLWTDNDEGERVVVTRCVDDRDEGSRVVAIVEEELLRRKLDLKDFAVLYRTNSQSRSIEDAFRRQGIPYTIIGSIAFYKRKEIKDVLAYLHLIANPADERSLLRVMNVPPRGIGEKTLAKLTSLATREGASLFDAIGSANLSTILPEGTCRKVKVLSDMLKKYLALKDQMSLGELARSIVDEIGLLRILKDENTAESLARRENIQELVSAITEFTEHRSEARLEDFLEEVSLVSDVDTADFGRNAVTLMTVHAAKGLEFPVVCMVGLEEGIFPLAGSLGEQQGLEEERRLMYVGMTRARLKLHLLYVSTRYRYGDHSYMVRSRFLDEIDAEFLTQSTYGERHEGRRRAAHSASLIAPQRHSRYEEQSEVRSEVIPSYEDESQEETHPTVGLRVHHASFGEGRIVALDGTGERARAIVDFDSVGKKVLLLKFAHLRSV
jgi:DNA helicase-2/ATP-dependent DNA helicase PcrA